MRHKKVKKAVVTSFDRAIMKVCAGVVGSLKGADSCAGKQGKASDQIWRCAQGRAKLPGRTGAGGVGVGWGEGRRLRQRNSTACAG